MSVNLPAITIWREPRGEGSDGMLAVAFVIRNRAQHGHPWPHDPDRVCLQRRQFSCWNDSDAQRDLYPDNSSDGTAYDDAVTRWNYANAAGSTDSTDGATYYVNAAVLKNNPFDSP